MTTALPTAAGIEGVPMPLPSTLSDDPDDDDDDDDDCATPTPMPSQQRQPAANSTEPSTHGCFLPQRFAAIRHSKAEPRALRAMTANNTPPAVSPLHSAGDSKMLLCWLRGVEVEVEVEVEAVK